MHSSDVVGVIAIVMIFGMPLLYAMVSRVLAHQERIELLRRGIVPPPQTGYGPDSYKADWKAARKAWRSGTVPPPPPGYDPYAYAVYHATLSLHKGVRLAAIGLAIMVGLSFTQIPYRDTALYLAGLIPLFIGLAQIGTAMLSGARFGPFGFGPPLGGPQPNQQATYQPPPFESAAATPPSGPYGWRPGSTPELERPTQPPDVK